MAMTEASFSADEALVDQTHLFIELQEMRSGILSETSRWNHALEEDSTKGQWSRPHLPTISIPALVKLRDSLTPFNVMIDVTDVHSLGDCVRKACAMLLTNECIQVEDLSPMYTAFTLRRKPSLVAPAEPNESDEAAVVSDAEEWFHLLDPDKGEEACDILLAHVDFLEQPVVAFLRLKEAIDIGCECHAPVRYMLLVAGPEKQERETVLMARAFAGIMLDESFVRKIGRVMDAQAFLDAFDAYNENVSILPHVYALPSLPSAANAPTAMKQVSNAESANDEDEVVVLEMEDEIRRARGMRPRAESLTSNSGVLDMLQRRPNFEDALSAEGEGEASEAETVRATPHTRRRLFIELEQQKKGSSEWAETHHWNWAFAQEAADHGKWRKPHLPVVSASALMTLHQGLGAHNVLLDLEAADLPSAVSLMLSHLVEHGALPAAHLSAAREQLHSSGRLHGASARSSPPALGHVLCPDAEEECFAMLLAHAAFLRAPLMAFARLATPAPPRAEQGAPVRFLFVMLAPPAQLAAAAGVATAFGGIMLDEDFVIALCHCSTVGGFAALLAKELNCVTLVPHSHLCRRGAAARRRRRSSVGSLASDASAPASPAPRAAAASPPPPAAPPPAAAPPPPPPPPRRAPAVKRSSSRQLLMAAVSSSARLPAIVRARLRRTIPTRHMSRCETLLTNVRRLSLPLVSGIFAALAWANLDPSGYEYFVGADPHLPHWEPCGDFFLFEHKVTFHFIVNDIFMAFFFGLAAKEVTEACLPGGSLNPPRKALPPLIATLGGVLGPIAVYLALAYAQFQMGMFDGYEVDAAPLAPAHHRRLAANASAANATAALRPLAFADLAKGWGVPTATDISLAWMAAVQVFSLAHSGIQFLLLLAVADDAIGLVIIATAYPDPNHPAQPQWLGLVALGLLVGFVFRRYLKVRHWALYILFAGVPAWVGLISAALHPALALAIIVPFLPAGPAGPELPVATRTKSGESDAAASDAAHEGGALHEFELAVGSVVEYGMFFFTLANAGVRLDTIGPLTLTVLAALVVGKLLGIMLLVLLAVKLGVAPLARDFGTGDLAMAAAMASVGLTVALFIAGEAFQDAALAGEAKMGALLSGLMVFVTIGISRLPLWKQMPAAIVGAAAGEGEGDFGEDDEEDVTYLITSSLERALLTRYGYLASAERIELLEPSRKKVTMRI